MTAQTHRTSSVDYLLGGTLVVIAAGFYSALFIHVPVLTEVRDFLLRFGRKASLLHVFTPRGDDFRPFSWKFFDWQHQLFGFQSEAFNLVQFLLLGVCALAVYIHCRQLLGRRTAAFVVAALWLFSLPVADAAFWQATQHDKLAFVFSLATLIVTLHAIRSERAVAAFYAPLALILAALAVASKPVAFMLPLALAAQLIFIDPGKPRAHAMRAAGVLLLPSAYVVLYAVLYALAMSPKWRAHTTSGNTLENLLIYGRNFANIDYSGSLIPAALLFALAGGGWLRAFWRARESANKTVLYLVVIFAASLVLLGGAAHASSYYLLLPLFGFYASLVALALPLLTDGSARTRRFAAIATAIVVLGLLTNYCIALWGPLRRLARSGHNLSAGYKTMRDLVEPESLQTISFYYPREPLGYFYFFSDGNHRVIDPMIPSFIFHRNMSTPINEVVGKLPSGARAGELAAVWSDDLRLTELRLSGTVVYRGSAAELRRLTYVPGKILGFQKGGNARPYLGRGWSREEDWGTWTDGPEATLTLALNRAYDVPLDMIVWAQAFVPAERPTQSVQVHANGRLIATWKFHHGESQKELRARMPAEVVGSDELQLSFQIAEPRSPESLGVSRDTRALGIMVEKLRLDPAPVTGP